MRNMQKVFIALWMALLVALGSYYLFLAPRGSEYSPEENRTLAGFPEITTEDITDGSFGKEIETYLLDRFPGRSQVINATNRFQNLVSFASHEEYLLIAEGPNDLLDSDDYQENLDDLLSGFDTEPTQPSQETEPSTQPTQPEETEPSTAPTEPPEDPPILVKEPASLEDFPEILGTYMDRGQGDVNLWGNSRGNVAAVTAVLNKYAQRLPEDGKLMFTVVPQSSIGNLYVNAQEQVRFYATWDDVVNGLGDDNVYAFDSAEILSQAIAQGEYVYFRTDMHWTPYGSYLVYSEMAQRAGKEPCSYTDDFIMTVEDPFRGTYYRDNPAVYMGVQPDQLEILMPDFPLEWRRINGPDTYELIDFLNFNANPSDRYTVYLGGPAGPWTYAECDNGESEACLVITDSFGLGYIPFLTTNYKQVHYYDTRYFNYNIVGYSVEEMIEKYEIQDIYVVVGDLHAFESSFIISAANYQLDAK